MSAMLTPRSNPPLCGILKVKLLIFFFLQFWSFLEAQQSNLSCNARTPFVNGAFSVSETHSSPGLACWEGDILCPGDDEPGNVINSTTTDFATGNIPGVGSLVLRVSDTNASNIYSAGNLAGFVVESGLLDAGVFSSITISTYLNGTFRESYDAIDLLTLNTDLFDGPFEIGFVTSMTFNEIQIEIDDFLGGGSYNVYYAFMERYCAGPALQCNVQTAMNKPTYPMTVDYANTGSSGVNVGNVDDPEDAVSASSSDYASLNNLTGVGSTFIAIEEQITNYPSGTFVGFDIQNLTIVSAEILNNLTITTYLNNVQQQQVSGGNLLIGAPLLSADGRHVVGFVTNTSVDKVKLTVHQPVNVTLGTTRVYSAIFRSFCDGPDLICNTSTSPALPAYPIFINDLNTGVTGLLCAGCSVNNSHLVIDSALSNYATIVITAGAANIGSLSVKDQLSDYPAGTFAGFHIENPSLVDANILEGITIVTYLDGVQQESETNLGALITVGTELLVNTGEQIVGFVTTENFDEVRIRLANTVALNIGTTRIYNLVLEAFCAATIECDTTYYLNNPTFPVYIDAFLTGADGVACVGCSVVDEQAVITASNVDYATITVLADALGSASLAVADALYTYPSGTFAGFVIEDQGFLIEAELFESLTVSTFNNGNFQEAFSGNDLLDLAVLILFISAENGRYNVGFQSSSAFDEIRITVGSLATAINQIRVYGSFVDTRSSSSGSLNCLDAPVANPDVADTDEDTPVIIAILENDSDSDNDLGVPVISSGPSNGSVTVNADSTITYTPAADFSGMDSFIYQLCDDGEPPLCDTALVIITISAVNDAPVAVNDPVSTDENTPVDVEVLNNDTDPDGATGIPVITDTPSNGTATVNADSTITYTPAPGFMGIDTFAYQICDNGIPSLCDTALVIVAVDAANQPPVAADDVGTTSEDAPVNIQVLDNDNDPDSPLGQPTVISGPDNGTVTYNMSDSSFTYSPDPDFTGTDMFSYSICDDGVPPLCDTAVVTITVNAVDDSIACNTRIPWIQNIYPVTEEHDSPGLACWEGDLLCPGGDVPANVVNTSTTDFATGSITGVGSLTLSVTDNTNTYAAGYFAGYVVSSGLFSAGLFNSVTITTYLDDVEQEDYQAVDLVGLSSSILSGPIEIGFVTTTSFDEIEITIDNLLGLGSYNVHYPIIEQYCAGPVLICNTQTRMNSPTYPVTIDYANTGSDGVSVGTVDDPEDAVSAGTTDYASLINVASVLGSTFLAVEEQVIDYPSGTFAGFDIENLTLAGAGVLNYITITSYLNDVEQEEFSGPDLLAGVPLLSSSGRHTVGFVTTTAVDKVKITVEQPVGVTVGTTRVYGAIFQKMCVGPALDCNMLSVLTLPEYPLFIDVGETGLTGAACGGCNVIEPGNVIDDDPDNFAQIIITAGVLTTGSIAAKDQLTDYPAGSFVGFRIENANLVDADALTGITVTTYLNGNFQEDETNLGALITVNSGLLLNDDQQVVGFVTSLPFDEAKISLTNVGAFNIGTTRVYDLIVEQFCSAVIECDSTYFLNSPAFPVYIDAFRTGVDGVACVLCEVNDEQNAITADTSDYATITVAANVIGSASIAVADALYTYPQGTFAGFVIEDLGFLIEADLFESLTISTYNNGSLQESMSGGDLIDLALLILFISADEGRYNVGFRTSLPFDEIRITVGSLVAAINHVRVYSAFVDTRVSNGGSLFCIAGPVAIDDQADTDEDTPVIIDVLDNDTEGDTPIGPPDIVDDPDNGTVTVNGDSTVTYIPDPDFVGLDTFTYAICDEGPLCDTAMVVITVHPVIDTIEETIPEDSTFTACANDLTIFTRPATSISVCDGPADGTLMVTGTCVEYDPNPGFTGLDTFCVYTCHPDDPSLCDTTIIIITVIPPLPLDDGPFAEPDFAVTNEDVTIDIDVLSNDSDPDSPLGIPVVIDLPSNGTASVNADSTILYTPDPKFVGVDSFTYAICDNVPPILCDTALVIVTVNPVTDTIYETIVEDSTIVECANDLTVFDPPATSISVCDGPSNGTASASGACVTYTPDTDYIGQDTFCVLVCHPDNPALCDTTIVVVTITPLNLPPDAVDDADQTDQNVPVTVDVLNNDIDPDSPTGDPAIVDPPSNGSVGVNADSTVTYTPAADFIGVDTFTYAICDDGIPVLCDTASVIIFVAPPRDTIIEVLPPDSTFETCISELTEIKNPDSFNICGLPSNGTMEMVDTCVQYVPDPDFEGQDTMCVITCDDNFCDTTIIIVIIECPNVVVKVLMEGPYDEGSGTMSTTLNEYHVLPGQDPTLSSNPGAQALGIAAPPGQPYDMLPWAWPGAEGDEYGDGPGDRAYDATVTDWILVSVRENDSLPTSEVWKCAGLLHDDGTVVFPEGCQCANVLNVTDSYYIVVEHRNHLPVMSTKIDLTNNELSFDFTQNQSWIFSPGGPPIGEGQKLMGSNYVMYAGNSEQISARVDINASDDNIWLIENGSIFRYKAGDHNMDGDVNATDEFVWLNNNAVFTLLPF